MTLNILEQKFVGCHDSVRDKQLFERIPLVYAQTPYQQHAYQAYDDC